LAVHMQSHMRKRSFDQDRSSRLAVSRQSSSSSSSHDDFDSVSIYVDTDKPPKK
jgi:hypothetical protein